MRGFYLGNATINQETFGEFIIYLSAYEKTGYEIEKIYVDQEILFSLPEFKTYINKVPFIKKICFVWKKNDNRMYLYNAKYFKEIWYIRHEIENEYDVYEKDKYTIYEEQSNITLFKKKFIDEMSVLDVRFGLFASVVMVFLFLSKDPIIMSVGGVFAVLIGLYFSIRLNRKPYKK